MSKNYGTFFYSSSRFFETSCSKEPICGNDSDFFSATEITRQNSPWKQSFTERDWWILRVTSYTRALFGTSARWRDSGDGNRQAAIVLRCEFYSLTITCSKYVFFVKTHDIISRHVFNVKYARGLWLLKENKYRCL